MKMTKRKLIAAVLVVVALGSLLVGTTFAYLTDSTKKVVNEFTVADNTTEIEEDFEKEDNQNFTKDVKIKNVGEADCLVRVRIEVSPASEIENITIDGQKFDDNWKPATDSHWFNGGDGFFYYTKAVASGETTDSIIKKVHVNDVNLMKDFDITVYEESVQTAVYNATTGTGDYVYAPADAEHPTQADRAILKSIWDAYEAK